MAPRKQQQDEPQEDVVQQDQQPVDGSETLEPANVGQDTAYVEQYQKDADTDPGLFPDDPALSSVNADIYKEQMKGGEEDTAPNE